MQKVVVFGVSCFLVGKNNLDEDEVEHVELPQQGCNYLDDVRNLFGKLFWLSGLSWKTDIFLKTYIQG